MKPQRIFGRMHKESSRCTSLLELIVVLILLFAGGVHSAQAQEASSKRGFQPGNSYSMSDFESINTTNGNVILNFNLGSLPGSRGLGGSMGLRYNSKLFDSDIEIVPDHSNQLTPQSFIVPAAETGNWRTTSTLDYRIKIVNRFNEEGGPYNCVGGDSYGNNRAVYIWKLKVVYPDGAEREFRPAGFHDVLFDGYFNVEPSSGQITGQSTGTAGCNVGSLGTAPNPLTYFSTDGTYTRLVITRGVGWVLSLPDGTRVTGGPGLDGAQYVYDRNGNYITGGSVTLPNGHQASGIIDQFGHYVAVEHNQSTGEDYYYSLGYNNQLLMWTVKWKTIAVYKPYETSPVSGGQSRGTDSDQYFRGDFIVVDSITLPAQAGTLSYHFDYNGVAYDSNNEPTSYTNGWGEVSGITMPTGAQVAYAYERDATHAVDADHPFRPSTRKVLDNSISDKTLTYQTQYDNTSSTINEHWGYFISRFGSTLTGPDGSVHIQLYNDTASGLPDAGLVNSETLPTGETIERTWQTNQPSETTAMGSNQQANFYVKRELHSIPNAAGTLTWTSIKEYNYDKNGNVTSLAEYDWVPYSTAHATGFSTSSLTPVRITTTTYKNPTVGADNHTSEQDNAYWNPNGKLIRNLPASTEIQGSSAVLSHTAFVYDNPDTTGNLTQKLTWDSTKGANNSVLDSSNSISAYSTFADWSDGHHGKLTDSTDAKGNVTHFTYGSVGGFELYPTQVQTAYGTSIQRTETRAYDPSSGLVTRVTDVDNGVSSSTQYDAFGRPILVMSAENTPAETHTVTEYADELRRVVVRADQNVKNDGMIVTIQHYDQLGRVRLSRQLEDGATFNDAYNEQTGIKVQTRYMYSGSNSYVVTSNAYRASTSLGADSEPTMGWTRVTSDNGGRTIERKTFSGGALPGPWGQNTNSTGAVSTNYDSKFTTVTDQANSPRRTMVDGLGRLRRVDEPDKDSGQLDSGGQPIQPTSYDYDAVDNLLRVNQSTQQRTFVYSSLSRLTSASNPESGTINYAYDNNGNLISKIDSRMIDQTTYLTTTYEYDQLNRIKKRTYNDGTNGTPEVNYTYDQANPTSGNPVYGKGRLYSVASSVSTYYYDAYDALGRVKQATQAFSSYTYTMKYDYDLAGHVLTTHYPSDNSTTNEYDSAGRLKTFQGNIGDGFFRTYASGISYSALGGLQQEQFGTAVPVYKTLSYNSRGQLGQITAGTELTGNKSYNRGKIVNSYGSTQNNGNLIDQTIYVPNNEDNTSPTSTNQHYRYDYLNRLTRVQESTANSSWDWQQSFTYDEFGNRKVDYDNTTINYTAAGLVHPVYDISNVNNRLYDPNHTLIEYDDAGNQKKDYFTDSTLARTYDRSYDADNRMTQSVAHTINGDQTSNYYYDGDGRRVKRNIVGTETWQIYGVGGELIAEYPLNGDRAHPQKEYGYRNGQLLITAESGTALGVAPADLKETGATTTSITIGWGTNNPGNYRIERKGRGGEFGYLNHNSSPTWTDNVDVGKAYLYRVCAADSSNNCTSAFSNIVLGVAVNFNEAIVGTSEVTNPADATTIRAEHINELRTAVNAVRYLALLDDATYSHPNLTPQVSLVYVEDMRELRARLNQALQVLHLDVAPFADPDLIGIHEDAAHASPIKAVHIRELRDRVKKTIGSSCYKSIDQFVKDLYQGVLKRQPTSAELSSATSALTAAQDSVGSALITAARNWAASLFNSNEYTNLGTSDGQFITDLYNAYLQRPPDSSGYQYWLDDLQGLHANPPPQPRPRSELLTAFAESIEFTGTVRDLCRTAGGGSTAGSVHWMITDQLGTPRMVLDASGSLATMGRHDYLPFGEELFGSATSQSGTGGRLTGQGYASAAPPPDGVRQQFTSKERDNETGLDFFEARYFSNTQGRFTSEDPYNIVMEKQSATNAEKAQSQFLTYISNPQRWVRYTYALNNPLLYTDPDGEDVTIYYRAPGTGTGQGMESYEDQGHILIYVRNDETGESAYFDYTAADKTGATTFLQRVTQGRLDAHARLTIVTDAKQEQAILDGIKQAQKGVPQFSLLSSTCSSNSAKLLALGGIKVAGATGFEGPQDLWQTAFSQFGDRQKNAAEPLLPNPNPMFPPIGKVHGLDDNPILGREYGHDPNRQGKSVDPRAVHNDVNFVFRGGKLVETNKKDLN